VALVRGGALALQAAWLELAQRATESIRASLRELLGGDSGRRLGLELPNTEFPEPLMLLVLLAGAALVGLGVYRLLDAPAPELHHVVLDLSAEERESLEERDSDLLERATEALRSRWPWRRRAPPPRAGASLEPGIREVVALYHRMLELARERGVALDPAHTPYERARRLRRELPGAPVDALTARFVAACYAGEKSPPQLVSSLREALEAAADPGRVTPRGGLAG
jgi:hypothetical protein